MAALKSRRVRLIFFLGLAAIAFVAAYVVATSEAKPSNVQMALVILGGLALFEPLRIAWEIITAKDETFAQSNRQILINQVRENWIEGVLQDALRDAEFDIAIKSTSEKTIPQPPPTEQPQSILGFIKTRWLRGDAQSTPIPNTPDSLAQTFKNANHKLLILGAPGGGKTVLMLQLAQRLLDEAETGKAIPVVFNLSSWGAAGGSIKGWIIAELKKNYGASPKYAKELVNGDSLIYLLDGLDEVAEARRNECVAELNAFITPTRQLVVCSRTEEYHELAEKLSITQAVEAQPLTDAQFQTYLNQYIKSSATVTKIIATLRENDKVWQEANKPLFINILISTYRDGKPFQLEHIQGDTRQKVQKLLIEPYVIRQLQNVPNAPLASEDVRRHLAWIGWWLNKQKQTVFYLEGLQIEGLQNLRLYYFLSMLSFGVFFGVATGLTKVPLYIFSAVLVGTIYGLVSPINVEQKLVLRRSDLLVIVYFGIIGGLFGGLGEVLNTGLFSAVLGGLFFGLFSGQRKLSNLLWIGLFFGMFSGVAGYIGSQMENLVSGLLSGLLTGGVFWGMIGGLFGNSTITQRNYFGQGVRNTLLFGLFCGLLGGLFGWLGALFIQTPIKELVSGPVGGLFGVLLGLMLFGLGDIYKHFLLRGFLRLQGLLPFRAVKFLHYARERRLLRQVGGGFIFIHRYVLDYFDDEYQARYLKKSAGG